MNTHLSARVKRKLRQITANEPGKPQILHKHGINSDSIKLLCKNKYITKLTIEYERI